MHSSPGLLLERTHTLLCLSPLPELSSSFSTRSAHTLDLGHCQHQLFRGISLTSPPKIDPPNCYLLSTHFIFSILYLFMVYYTLLDVTTQAQGLLPNPYSVCSLHHRPIIERRSIEARNNDFIQKAGCQRR